MMLRAHQLYHQGIGNPTLLPNLSLSNELFLTPDVENVMLYTPQIGHAPFVRKGRPCGPRKDDESG
ncbi:hypothetical protein IHE44_0012306 [Lamprotornis superbus]|uniref:Uncharacterized protein n=1 Tax=Lamprotornis superbus TaxID=245042 RepID=A0A835NSY3_9PASS|nr:hypothetical protein IHE44_0012306 [Lamprotornis superbus]